MFFLELIGAFWGFIQFNVRGNNFMAVIRAVELGFGTSSFTTGEYKNHNPIITTFSSLVSQVDPTKEGLSAGLNSRDTVRVKIKDSYYEVGADAALVADKKSARVLNNTYISSHQYQALLLGALYYINEPTIDLLVLGLPVENWGKRDELKNLVIGKHEINGRFVEVKDAWVIVQPLGGLLAYANSIGQDGYNELRGLNVLSVDPGYGTYDWIVSQGLKVNDSRSGGEDLGMSAVLDSVSKVLRLSFPTLTDFPVEKLDEAFYKHKDHIRIAGRKYPFPVCKGKDCEGDAVNVEFDLRGAIETVTRAAVTKMKNVVGNGGDIDEIILMGGPHEVYKNALQEAYPNHKIKVVKNPLTAVCAGMHFGGLQYYQALTKAKVA